MHAYYPIQIHVRLDGKVSHVQNTYLVKSHHPSIIREFQKYPHPHLLSHPFLISFRSLSSLPFSHLTPSALYNVRSPPFLSLTSHLKEKPTTSATGAELCLLAAAAGVSSQGHGKILIRNSGHQHKQFEGNSAVIIDYAGKRTLKTQLKKKSYYYLLRKKRSKFPSRGYE